MKKRILLIETSGVKANVFDDYMKLPLMGTLYLGTILHDAGHDVKVLNENILGKKVLPFTYRADIVCLTSLTVNVNRTRELATEYRQIYPDIKIIIGGIHATVVPYEFEDVADHIVVGEAEEIIVDVINGKYTDKIIHGRPVQDMDKLPLVNYSLLENYKAMDIAPVMTSRGCPFNCRFCSVTAVFGKKFREQSVDRIMAEIKNMQKYLNTLHVFFYDDNFTSNKKRINELTDRIISEKIRISWTAQVRSDVAKDEDLLVKMYRAGCERFYIGFESIDDDVLKSMHKSQTRKDIIDAIRIIRSHGISIHGMFIFGEDNDTIANIESTVDFAVNYDIDTVQFMILTPFPGTEVYKEMSDGGRLLHHNWGYYDGMHALIKNPAMSPFQLQLETIKAYRKFYSLKRTLLEMIQFAFNVCFDAVLWNLKRDNRYNLNNLFIRFGALFIVKKFMFLNRDYLHYLKRSA
ncbi:MAG: B12-binding domain-containing radical SAM protein [Oligoflexia bacterium]|nr:B12-binding domain-containing radical SAM protein [Oligoflexia bacterium]